MNTATKTTYQIAFFLVFCYIIIRGFSLGITHDEALTYQILSGDELIRKTANHHWLNTFLSGLSIQLFGEKEFALRIPNIVSFLLYWIFTYKIAKHFFNNSFIQIALLFLLIGNPYVLEFFSLSRGYGISVACIMAALFYLLRGIDTYSSPCNYILALLFATLALSANLNTINFFLVLVFLILVQLLFFHRQRSILLLGGIISFSTIILYFSLNRLFFLKNLGELYFGSERITLSIDSLLCSSFPILESCEYVFILRYILFLALIAAIILAIKNRKINHPGSISLILLGGIFIGLVLEHLIFDALYPVGRSTIYLYPLIILSILFNLELQNKNRNQIGIVGIATLFLCFNLMSFNVNHVTTWLSDQHVKRAMLNINQDIKDNQIHSIECTWIYEPLVNYYREVYHIPVQKVFRDGISGQSDYYLVHSTDSVGQSRIPNHHILFSHEEECDLILLKKLP